ncbi:hypothetical protein FHJ30_20055 [Arthrobacter sp. BB-1]|jgi:hypothetical protein|uniref:hypothetical protein n=1 Tax=Micrococcaceae TaxID=1268 RepID=UPI0010E3474E|nr:MULTISPECIES: hypothetical protein [Micrococcaceae]TNB68396.1 hypothetical protein FHJ30_20055 [Arthrobacter sp. BB-1]UEL28563.1 hypothetical protein KTR40_18805 [Pseudarthrobacter sp. L1SW]VII98431.1 hypothetical protein [Arthrobacter sp. DR-2P]
MIDLAGLLAIAALLITAALLVTLIALEIRRAGPGAERPTRLLGLTIDRRVVGVMWVMYLLLFVPRVVGLLT